MLEWLSRGSGRSPPALDRAYLDRLEAHLGAEVLTELMADGLIEIADRLSRLSEAAEGEDRDAAARIGHDIAGVAGHLGLSALSHAAVAMNRSLRGETGRTGDTRSSEVLDRGARAMQALREELDRRTAHDPAADG